MSNNDHNMQSSALPEQTVNASTVNQEAAPAVTQQAPKKTFWTWKLVTLVALFAVALLYSVIDINASHSNEPEITNNIPPFDTRILLCNDVLNAVPSDAFQVCEAMAQEGNVAAIKRMIWAYSRQSEYQNLTKVFEWLRALPYKDNATQLLMFSLVHLNTESDTLRKDSEVGITRLVAKNYAPANVVLASIYALEENTIAPTSNTLWLLTRASMKDPIALSPSMLALVHANGFLGDINIAAGAAVLTASAEREFPMMTNNIAWFLSTLDTNPFTPSEYALGLAKRVVENANDGQNHIYVDTLAAAYAANNMFTEAIDTQRQAIELLQASNASEKVEQNTVAQYESRLTLYSQNQVLVEDKLIVEKNTFFTHIRNRVLEYVLRDFYIPTNAPVSK